MEQLKQLKQAVKEFIENDTEIQKKFEEEKPKYFLVFYVERDNQIFLFEVIGYIGKPEPAQIEADIKHFNYRNAVPKVRHRVIQFSE